MPLTTEDLSAISHIVDTKVTNVVTGAIAASEKRMTAKMTAMEDRLTGRHDSLAAKFDIRIDSLAAAIADDFARFEDRFDILEDDVATIKTDVRAIKWELTDTVRRSEHRDAIERIERLERKILD